MTTLLIQTETTPLTVNFPAIVQMTHEQFYEFYRPNQEPEILDAPESVSAEQNY